MSFRRFFRELMFMDVKKIILLARTKVLQPEDLPPLPERFDPRRIPFDESKLDLSGPRQLVFSMLRAGKKFLLPAFLLNLLYIALNLTKPVLVNKFIATISAGISSQDSLRWALFLAIALGLVSFIASLVLQHYFLRTLGAYQTFTNAINKLIFSHALMLTQKARSETQVGDVVNHMSSDSDSISDVAMIFGELQISVITMLGVSGLLLYYLGFTAFGSIALLLLLVPLTRKIAREFSSLDEELMKHRDSRVTMMSQVLNGIRVVKYFAWEKSVKREVDEVRAKELHARKRLARAEAVATLSYTAVSTIVLFATLGLHVWRGYSLTPELAFTCVALFALLEEPFGHLSEIISRIAAGYVGGDRICKFLHRERLHEAWSAEQSDKELPGLEVAALSLCHDGQKKRALDQINFRILPGESLAIVGPVGSGKSSLFQALLREVPLLEGNFSFRDIRGKNIIPRIAYVPQEAYILNGSLKENVLFGEAANEERLKIALAASCLDADLAQLPAGLFTEIGERGVNLSGGQKQRVSLARAVMHNPNLVLLDDPLSAVDVRTEDHLIDRLLFGEWKSITRLVVSHRLAHLHRFDKILFLKDGAQRACGSLEELLNNQEFLEFYSEYASTEKSGSASLGVTKDTSTAIAAPPTALQGEALRVTEDEDRAVGAVQGSVYLQYIRALGGKTPWRRLFTWPLLVCGTAAGAALPLLQKSWLAFSSNLQSGKLAPEPDAISSLAQTSGSSILVYGGLGLLTLLGVLLNKLFWLERGMAAGRDMHDGMLAAMLKAPLRFFDSTPVGRILQRFSRDVEAVDIQLQWSFETTVKALMNIATSLVLILGVMPLMIVVIGPVLFFYYLLQRDYRVPAREAKRLDSISRSPRFAHFKETLHGLVVIRSFGKAPMFMDAFFDRLHHAQRMFYGHYMLNRWFSSRIPLLGAIVSSCTAIAVVFYAWSGGISPGAAGLVMVYALSLWESLNWAIRIFAEAEARMTSVERIRYYSAVEAEEETVQSPALAQESAWPVKGEVVFDRVVARYASHLPPVLKSISLRVPAGSRVGIIGRTGSGKSTLLQALFRCMELESGAIRIDGVDIASVPLERLRRSLAIIPQDPTLFLGTLRSNLDRYSEHRDNEIWQALHKARLENFVRSMPLGLDAPVQENGSNLSQGQRQLLCLARALLADAKVVVMDEATASVDVQTDTLVQEVVRESCKNVTMLIIAHRLGTVADCDLIFEVKEGKLHRTLDLKKQEAEAPIQ
jgi:ABC-type multidrug transport system fused ATPase/permease subunit